MANHPDISLDFLVWKMEPISYFVDMFGLHNRDEIIKENEYIFRESQSTKVYEVSNP